MRESINTTNCAAEGRRKEYEPAPGGDFGYFSEPALLVLANLAGSPKHSYAMAEDLARLSHIWMRHTTFCVALAWLEQRELVESRCLPRSGGGPASWLKRASRSCGSCTGTWKPPPPPSLPLSVLPRWRGRAPYEVPTSRSI